MVDSAAVVTLGGAVAGDSIAGIATQHAAELKPDTFQRLHKY